MENKNKRFYKIGEVVWSIADKQEAKVLEINKDKKTVVIELGEGTTAEVNLWDIDKLKYKAKEKLIKQKRKANRVPTVYFAKVREDAIIPSKRDEDAGYDLYANIEPREIDGETVYEMFLPVHKTTL